MQNIIYCDHTKIKDEEVIIKNKGTIFYISLSDCAKNFSVERSTKKIKCVADRDVSSLSYIFYTKPKTKVIFKKHHVKDLFFFKSASRKFFDLQTEIIKAGYMSYDLS